MHSRPSAFQARLRAIRLAFESGPTPPEDIRILNEHVSKLQQDGLAERAIRVGMQAPEFLMRSTCGRTRTLGEILPNGPAVLTWFRGNW